MKKINFLILLLIFTTVYAFSQQTEYDKAITEIQSRGEVQFKFDVSSTQQILVLTKIISIDNVKNNEVFAYANKPEFLNFLTYGINYEVIEHVPSNKTTVATTVAQMASWDRYPSYDVLVQMMNQFATDYPTLCTIENIGNSTDGRQILVAKISDNVNTDEDEPEYFYSSTMHGDEIVGLTLFLRLADYLLSNYGTDPEVTNIVDNIEIYICPAANPDGTYNGGNTNVSNATRYNAQGIDLNRNFPSMTGGDHPDGNQWATETVLMMDFANNHNINMGANCHGGAEVLNYPWDHWTSTTNAHADDNWWQYVSNIYASNAQADAATVGMSNYLTSVTSSGYVEGGDWYVVDGSRQDWMTYYKYARETTLELHNTKLSAATNLPNYWIANKQAFLDYMEEVLYGIRGIITDGCSGQPMVAKVEIVGHDQDNSEVYSSLPVGNYHRPIYAGSYDVTYSAPGYQSQTINNITVTNGNTVVQNITLTPAPPVADFSASDTTTCNGTVDFTCSASGVDTWLWDFGDGGTSTDENPSHSYTANGTYTVTLTVSNCSGVNTDSEVKTNYITINAPTAPSTTGASNCGAGSVILNASGSGTLDWYDATSGGTFVNTGNSYTTPSLSSTTTYYVENVQTTSTTYNVGSTNSSANGTYHNGSWYIQFDAYKPFILRSVEVNAQSAGTVTIDLVDGSGTIETVSASATAGVNRINLDLNIPAGTGLGLELTSGINLWRNNAGISYPYEIPGIVSITSSSAGTGYYYYFYDWEIEDIDTCISVRTPVVATIETPVSTGINISTPTTTICTGDNISFTATPTNGGTTPSYQWQINSSNVGTNNSSFSSSSLNDGDIVTCILTSSEPCNDSPVTSNNVTMTVTPSVNVGVSINPGSVSICPGDNVTFTATPTNGGTTPSYEWFVNGGSVQAGANNTYSTTSLNDGDIVSCDLTSSISCNDGIATSNSVNISLNPTVNVGVNITTPSTTICLGENITFTASPTNGGTSPIYQWRINGSNAGSGGNTFSSNTLNDGDIISCILTSSEPCNDGPTSSNNVTITVNTPISVGISIATSNTSICSGETVTFNSTPTNGGSSPSYEWYINATSVQTGSNSAFSSSTLNDGDIITCELTSSEPCNDGIAVSNSVTINVNSNLPVSNSISASSISVCTGDNVTFTATPTNGGATPSYEWFVNSTSVQSGVLNTFSSSGLNDGDVITCDLTSSELCSLGSPATSNPITINVSSSLPVSTLIAGNTNFCSGDAVLLTATPTNEGGTPNYEWFVNGSPVQSGSSETYTSTTLSDGDNVYCIITSSLSCATGNPATSNTLYMTVNASLPASISIAGNINICAGENTTFTATPINGGASPSYEWFINSGSVQNSTSETFITTALNDGDILTCTLTSSASCATGNPANSNTLNITVQPNASASISISGNTAACTGDNITMNATTVNEGTSPVYEWFLNGSPYQTGSSNISSSSFNDGDLITCTMTSSENCIDNNPVTSNAVNLSIENYVTADVSINGNNTICAGESITFNATPTEGGSNPNYEWFVDGNSVQTGSNSGYITSTLADGNIITCEMTSSKQCANNSPATSNTIAMAVSPNLTVAITIAGNTNICIGENVTFTANATNEGVTPNYEWFVNGGSVQNGGSDTYSSNALNDGDIITCTVSSSETCVISSNANSNTLTMTVDPIPVANFNYNAINFDVDFTNLSLDATSYMWNFGDFNTSNMPNPSHSYVTPGTYNVTLIAYNTCSSDTIIITIDIITNIIETGIAQNIYVYPNPTEGLLTIEFERTAKKAKILVTDLIGNLILTNEVNDIDEYQLDLHHLSGGVYLIQVNTENKLILKKIVIK